MKLGRILIILLLVALAGFVGLRVKQNVDARREAASQPVPDKIVPVETAVPRTLEVVERIRASANIQADAEVTIYSKVGGKIAQNLVKMGSAVEPGQVVAVVNRDEVGYDYKPFEVKSDAKGVVSRLLLNPGAAVNASIPLMTLVDIDTVKAMAAVDEKKIRFISMGQPALVTLEAYPGEAFSARVTNISPVANPVNRTIEVELSIPNPGHRIKPGMYAEAEWTAGRRRALVVPLVAVVERAGQKYVFLATGGRAEMRSVQTGVVIGDSVEVLAGLSDAERIITIGASQLDDKDKVTLVERPIEQK
jgi:membrane fusion protein (multidrug efflux system)